jgi:hypothetical protein
LIAHRIRSIDMKQPSISSFAHALAIAACVLTLAGCAAPTPAPSGTVPPALDANHRVDFPDMDQAWLKGGNVSQLKGVQGQVAQIDQSTVKYDTNVDGSVNYNSVTMGGNNSTGPVTVHNVAPGVEGTDAVNVNQLNAGLDGAKQYTDQRISQLNGDLRKVGKEASAGTASAMAMANLPQAYLPGKSMVSVGVGGFDGEAGVALGVSKLSDNGRWVVKFSASGNTRGKFGVGAGAGFHW